MDGSGVVRLPLFQNHGEEEWSSVASQLREAFDHLSPQSFAEVACPVHQRSPLRDDFSLVIFIEMDEFFIAQTTIP